MMEEVRRDEMDVTRTKQAQNPINYWKIAFIILCCLILGLIGGFFYRAHQPVEGAPNIETVSTNGKAKIELSLTKNQSNKILSYYLNQMVNNKNMKLRFSLDDQALIVGKFQFLSVPMNFYLYFDPIVMENGNVKFKATSLSIGDLKLPITFVLNSIKRENDLPEWIKITPDKKELLLQFNKLSLDNGITIRAKDIDLANDQLRFDVYLPTE